MLAGAVLWGTAGAALVLGPEAAAVWQVATARLMIGSAGLLVGARLVGHLGPLPRPRVVVLTAGAAMAVFQIGYFTAITRTGVALGTAVAIGSGPVLAGAVERVALRVRPERRWWPATALAVVGAALLLGAGGGPRDALGVAAGLVAGLGFAVFAVASRRLLADHADPTATMGWLLAVAAAVLAPLAVGLTWTTSATLSWVGTPAGLAMLGWLSVGATTAAYWLFGRGLVTVPAATAATLVLAEPLTAVVLGVGALGERPTARESVGAALVLTGLAVLTVRRRR